MNPRSHPNYSTNENPYHDVNGNRAVNQPSYVVQPYQGPYGAPQPPQMQHMQPPSSVTKGNAPYWSQQQQQQQPNTYGESPQQVHQQQHQYYYNDMNYRHGEGGISSDVEHGVNDGAAGAYTQSSYYAMPTHAPPPASNLSNGNVQLTMPNSAFNKLRVSQDPVDGSTQIEFGQLMGKLYLKLGLSFLIFPQISALILFIVFSATNIIPWRSPERWAHWSTYMTLFMPLIGPAVFIIIGSTSLFLAFKATSTTLICRDSTATLELVTKKYLFGDRRPKQVRRVPYVDIHDVVVEIIPGLRINKQQGASLRLTLRDGESIILAKFDILYKQQHVAQELKQILHEKVQTQTF